MGNKYTMFGYDAGRNPKVAANVTPGQAKVIAGEKGLTGFFLAPHSPPASCKADVLTYKRQENGHYGKWTLREWTFAYHLDRGDAPRDDVNE